MRVSRSLTIKQMAMVSAVTMLFVLLFCVILLFHSVQQNRYNTASQLESIARSVRGPLSASILKGDIPEAETILKRIQPAGIVSRADECAFPTQCFDAGAHVVVGLDAICGLGLDARLCIVGRVHAQLHADLWFC